MLTHRFMMNRRLLHIMPRSFHTEIQQGFGSGLLPGFNKHHDPLLDRVGRGRGRLREGGDGGRPVRGHRRRRRYVRAVHYA